MTEALKLLRQKFRPFALVKPGGPMARQSFDRIRQLRITDSFAGPREFARACGALENASGLLRRQLNRSHDLKQVFLEIRDKDAFPRHAQRGSHDFGDRQGTQFAVNRE